MIVPSKTMQSMVTFMPSVGKYGATTEDCVVPCHIAMLLRICWIPYTSPGSNLLPAMQASSQLSSSFRATKKMKNQTNPSSPSIPAANRTRPQHGDQRGVIPAWRQAAAALAPVLLPLEQGGFRKPAAKSNKRKIKGLNKRKSPLLHLA